MAVIRGWLKRSQRDLDHDPQIDEMKTLWRKEHLKERDFALLAGLSVQTVHKMFSNQTKRPQFLTYSKMARAMGHTYTLMPDHKVDYEAEIPKARDELREYQAELKKKRERATKKKGNGG
jgi:transcriptional regulator with XRE-family HTH domain